MRGLSNGTMVRPERNVSFAFTTSNRDNGAIIMYKIICTVLYTQNRLLLNLVLIKILQEHSNYHTL